MRFPLINYYHVLGLDFNERPSKKSIVKQWKKLSLIYHPDKQKNQASAHVTQSELNEAHRVLTEHKKEYDQFLAENPLLNEKSHDIVLYQNPGLPDGSNAMDSFVDSSAITPYQEQRNDNLSALIRNGNISAAELIRLAKEYLPFAFQLLDNPKFLIGMQKHELTLFILTIFSQVEKDPDLLKVFNDTQTVKFFLDHLIESYRQAFNPNLIRTDVISRFIEVYYNVFVTANKHALLDFIPYSHRLAFLLLESPHIKKLRLTEIKYIVNLLNSDEHLLFKENMLSKMPELNNRFYTYEYLLSTPYATLTHDATTRLGQLTLVDIYHFLDEWHTLGTKKAFYLLNFAYTQFGMQAMHHSLYQMQYRALHTKCSPNVFYGSC